MKKISLNPEVDAFIAKTKQWRAETEQLRSILLDCGLTEALKWGKPCYSADGKNIVIIQGFKEYFALLFFKGVLLKDPRGILVKTGPNTEVGRQIRFSGTKEIIALAPVIKEYIREAEAIERSGAPLPAKEAKTHDIPDELTACFKEDPAFKAAFNALTAGRRNAYLFYFAAAKQSKTRTARIEKVIPKILDGKGLND